MKILLLNDDFLPEARGGSAVIVYRLAKKFKELNHEVLVVTTVRDKTKAGNFKLEDIEVFRIYSKYPYRFRAYVSLYNPKVISGLKKVIESFSPDVINFHNIHEYFSYASLSMAKKFSKPIFLTMHDVMAFSYGKLFPKVINYQKGKIPQVDYRVTFFDSLKRAKLRFNPFRNLIIRHYLKYPDKIFSVSGELKKVLELHGIKNIEPIYNGINLEEKKFSPATTQLLKEKFNLSDKKVVLFAGRLSGPKGGEVILKAIAKLKDKIPSICLVAAGEKQGYGQTMTELAKNLGISKNLIITGWLSAEEINALYDLSNICVVPSVCFDSFPTVVLEAMAHRLPIVASWFGGAKEIIENSKSGYLVNPYDIDDLSEKITSLLENKELAQKMGENGYKIINSRFSLDQQAQNYLLWYNKLNSNPVT